MTARKIVWMAIQPRRDVKRKCVRVRSGIRQLLPHGVAQKRGLHVLRKQTQAGTVERLIFIFPALLSEHTDAPGVGHEQSRRHRNRRGFSRAVSTEDAENLLFIHRKTQVPQNIGRGFFVAEKDGGKAQRLPARGAIRRVWQAPDTVVITRLNHSLPLPHRQRARLPAGRQPRVQTHRRRHPLQNLRKTANLLHRLARLTAGKEMSRSQKQQSVGHGENLLGAVFDHDDRQPELPVQPGNRREKIFRGNRVKLCRRLVEQEDLRLHDHDRGEVEQLLLSTGQLGGFALEQVIHAEIRRHLRHPAADGLPRQSHVFRSERQLVPHAIGDNLLLGTLQDKPDRGGRRVPVLPHLTDATPGNLPAPRADRRQLPLEQAQKRRFSASGLSADREKITLCHRKGNAVQHGALLSRVGKAQIFDFKHFHFQSSANCKSDGKKARIPYET